MHKGTTPKEEILVPDGTNDEAVREQKEAHEWWEKLKSKRALRSRHRNLTVTGIWKLLSKRKEIWENSQTNKKTGFPNS